VQFLNHLPQLGVLLYEATSIGKPAHRESDEGHDEQRRAKSDSWSFHAP
jgi:hypothetical protein